MAAYLFESPFHRFLRETLTRRGTLLYDRFIEPAVWIAAAATGMRPPNSLAFTTFGAGLWRSWNSHESTWKRLIGLAVRLVLARVNTFHVTNPRERERGRERERERGKCMRPPVCVRFLLKLIIITFIETARSQRRVTNKRINKCVLWSLYTSRSLKKLRIKIPSWIHRTHPKPKGNRRINLEIIANIDIDGT